MNNCPFSFANTKLDNILMIKENRNKIGELFYITRSMVDAEGWIAQLFNQLSYRRSVVLTKENKNAPDDSLLKHHDISYYITATSCKASVSDSIMISDHDSRFKVFVSFDPSLERKYTLKFVCKNTMVKEPYQLKANLPFISLTYRFNHLPDRDVIKQTINDFTAMLWMSADEAYEEFCQFVRASHPKAGFNWFNQSGKFIINLTGTRHYNLSTVVVRKILRRDQYFTECLLRTMMSPSKTIIVK